MRSFNNKLSILKEAITISLVYLILGSAWVLFSDDAVGLFKMDQDAYSVFETYKGLTFVFITAILLFMLLGRLIKRLKTQQNDLDKTVKERTAELKETVVCLEKSELQKDILLKNMQSQLRFEQLIFELSQDFLNAKLENIDAELEKALKRIHENTDEDCICYFKYDWNRQGVDLQIQQYREGISPFDCDWDQPLLQYAQEMLEAHSQGEHYCIEDTNTSGTQLATVLRKHGIRSFLSIPVGSNDRPRGFIGLYSKDRVEIWKPNILSMLSIFSEMVKNLYNRVDKEEALRKSNSRMRVILDSTRDGICMLDREGYIIMANNAFAKQYNADSSNMTGMSIGELLPPERYLANGQIYKKVLETREPQIYHCEDSDHYYEGTLYPVFDDDGQINAVAAFIADNTIRIRNEREIFRSKKIFEQLIHNAPVGIYWKDLEGRLLGCNALVAEHLGTTPEQMLGKTNSSYMPEDVACEMSHHDRQVIESKTMSLNYLCKTSTNCGENRIFKFNKVPLTNEKGEIYALLGVSEDVTEQHQRENELIQARQEARAANKAKSVFLSNMSHEIRTPLNAIIGLTHVAARSDDANKIKDLLEKVDLSAKHLLSIVNDILDLSRIEAGKMSVSRSEIDLINAIEEVFGIVMPRADEKKQQLDLYIDKELPRYVLSDAIRFKQVLINLLFNAVKFTPKLGNIAVRAKVLKKQGKQVIVNFSVTDNGAGIDKDTVDKLFRPFEQADNSSTREFKGAGLGLTISRSIIELMGGEIGATGERGKGSTFYFTLPLEVADKKPPVINVTMEDLKVLVVDDDEETCVYMDSLFSQFGVWASWVTSGKKAVEAIDKSDTDYNIVFVDWQMPEMNGIETVKKIREIAGPDTFVIMFSMFEWGEIEHQAKEAGVTMFLSKPVFPSRLFNTLLQICKQTQDVNITAESSNDCLDGWRLLVAEDILINQYILSEILKHTGVIITQATDGQQALDIFKEQNGAFDAILMDIQMPVMDGIEATKQIRSSKVPSAESIPIIAMTANVFKDDIDKALMAGMDEHISKPVDPDGLIETLRQYAGLSSMSHG